MKESRRLIFGASNVPSIIGFETGFLDDLAPFAHFRLYECGKLLGRAARSYHAGAEQPIFDVLAVQHPHDLHVELVDYGRGCLGDGKQALLRSELVAWHAGFGYGRQLRSQWRALRTAHSKRSQSSAGFDVLGDRRRSG